uniref:hypothetical protein n=1 Tax=Micromonospora sp. MH33 TaxID=1945509 RepID=UPI000D14B955|nr:hypothetical protein [Micromonospora sp. MH33]PSK65749.1 hypothetical protein B0E53_02301 [Micromonospora sp. MH33]
MPPHPHRPPELAWQVFRGSDVVRRGLLTRHQLRGASWVRLRQDVYADARLDRDHTLACRAALLRLPPEAVIAGPSAAYLHGVEHAAGFEDAVHVVLPAAVRADSQPGVRVHHAPSAPERNGLLVAAAGSAGSRFRPGSAAIGSRGTALTADAPGPADGEPGPLGRPPRRGPAECAWETAVWSDPLRAVAVIDTLLRRGLVSRAGLAALADRDAGRPGGRRARWVFGLADPGAQSPPESHLRVRLVLAGLPRPVARHPVRGPEGLVLHPDLAWPAFRVAVEYDGQWHSDLDQLHRDRRRLDQLVGAGWLVLYVTGRRLHREFPALVREIRAALVTRGWRP